MRMLPIALLPFLHIPLVGALSEASEVSPHIIWIVADDLGHSDVSFRGASWPTPNIDMLAATGVVLDNYYVQSTCSPTRSAFMTGRYAYHTGFQHVVLWQDQNSSISYDDVTIAERLTGLGYHTALVGKYHCGHDSWRHTPLARGFAQWYGWNGGSSDYYTHMQPAQLIDPNTTDQHWGFTMFDGLDVDFYGGERPLPDYEALGTHSTDLWTTKAVSVIEAHDFSSTPLFLYLGYQAPHSPLQVPPVESSVWSQCLEVTPNVDRATYCAMVSHLDLGVGRVLQSLEASNAWGTGSFDDAVVIFTTDNGGAWPSENAGCNYPLRGGKHNNFQGGVLGLGLISGGGFFNGPMRDRDYHTGGDPIPPLPLPSFFDGLMHAVDWLPTILDIAQQGNNDTTTTTTTKDAAGEGASASSSIHVDYGGSNPIDGLSVWPALIETFVTAKAKATHTTVDKGGGGRKHSWEKKKKKCHKLDKANDDSSVSSSSSPPLPCPERLDVVVNIDPLDGWSGGIVSIDPVVLAAVAMTDDGDDDPDGAAILCAAATSGTAAAASKRRAVTGQSKDRKRGFKIMFTGAQETVNGGVGWLPCTTMVPEAAPVDEGGGVNGTTLLFDLDCDPHERTDLSRNPSYAGVLALLEAKWRAATQDGDVMAPQYPPSDVRSYPELHPDPSYYGSWAPWIVE